MQTPEAYGKRKGLGRGLGSLLGGPIEDEIVITTTAPLPAPEVQAPQEKDTKERLHLVGIERVRPNPDQPRRVFNKESLDQLAASIQEKGILQPIVVRKKGEDFEIIAGERRWRAAQIAGLQDVPVIVRATEDRDSLELALIENIQRSDLNPIEEAEAYERLAKTYFLTQQEIAQKIGKDRATIANMMRLLDLEPRVRAMLASGEITIGHGKVLLAVTDNDQQLNLAKATAEKKLSVRALENLISSIVTPSSEATNPGGTLEVDVSARLSERIAEELQKALATKVQVDYRKKRGRITIHFYGDEQFNSLITRLKGV